MEDEIWELLHVRAKQTGLTISELVRQAVRERYAGGREHRRDVMRAFVGSRADRKEIGDATKYIRDLRKDDRLDRLN